jgi:predicted nucleotidyltransferase
MSTNYAKLLAALHDEKVEFIIVGGLAATIHGSTRLTLDIDICYSRSEANLERLVTALAPHRPYLRGAPEGLPFDWSVHTLRAGLNFTLTTKIGFIDLLGEIAGGGRYENLLPHSESITLFGHPAKCLNLEWLIRTKRAAGRPKDLEAIAELELIRDELS